MIIRSSFFLVLAAIVITSLEAFQLRPAFSSSKTTFSIVKTSTQLSVFGFLNDGKKALVKSLAGEYDQAAIQARMQGLVDANPVLMLSFTTCPYCIKAKKVLDDMGAKYTVVELDTDMDGKAIRAEMADLLGRTSVPAIWIGREFIGGCNDGPMGGVVKLQESGKLKALLEGVGAI